jgi:hypothetical protein
MSPRPETYPPLAPPMAFPSVPVRISTFPVTPCSSCVPRPWSPTNPAACQSSTLTKAPYSAAAREVAIHGEDAVCGNQTVACVN